MAKLFKIDILSPERIIYSGEVSSLIAPAQLGYLGVLADHAPLIANLVAGKISLKNADGAISTIESSGKGILEVIKNKVTILLDSVD